MPQRIVLFGPQGSASVFSAAANAQALDDAHSCPRAATLLARCHQAFVQDAQTLATHTPPVFQRDGVSPPLPQLPEELLSFPTLDSTHPIIEGSRLCLLQLLRHIRFTCQTGTEPTLSDIIEVTGCCSGLLPAVAVATSSTLDELITRGVASFRLAFWIGFYSWLWCQQIEEATEPDSTWSLLVKIGESPSPEVLETLKIKFPHICDAGPADDGWRTFSGPSKQIAALRDLCSIHMGLIVKVLRVHGCFHGGNALELSAELVCREARARSIDVPEFRHLRRPLRSPVDGEYISSTNQPDQSLLEVIVGILLVRPFDWVTTSARVAERLNNLAVHDPQIKLCLDSVGPGSKKLVDTTRKRTKLGTETLTVNHLWLPVSQGKASCMKPDDIAIVGMAVNLPGAQNADDLWSLIQQGLSTVQSIPPSRFDVSQFSADSNDKTGRTMNATHGNFLDDIWSIDSSFFKITPREAKTMDPQQKVLLRTAKSALEDAGFVADSTTSFQRESFGCYVGVATNDYTDNLRNDIDVYYSPGTLRAFLSGKISYHYKFSGPSVVIDTACSSSAVALYQACRALRNGDCTAALAGGVNTITSPDMYLGLDRGHFLNSSGQCKPFDAAADGYCRAEGCGLFVLKRLSDALAENDRIRAVIRGVEINQSGCSRSITHPDPSTQASLFQKVLRNAGVEKQYVDVIEAHGTGTQAGDVSEVRSLHSVFNDPQSVKPVIVSSVKGNIGHCEAASGAAGLAKLLLMFQHGEIPAQASLQSLNPAIADFVGKTLSIPRENLRWNRYKAEPRRAMLNNFGAAGSNVALLLEEYVQPSRSIAPLVSRQWLARQEGKVSLLDVCYTITARRQLYESDIAISCKTVPDLLSQVESLSIDPVIKMKSSKNQPIFVFSGQGGTYAGMGKELLETCPQFQRTVSECDDILHRHGFPTVASYLSADLAYFETLTYTQQLVVSQCACVVLQYALAKLYISWNILPKCIIGHSLGEFAALAIAGVIRLEDCLRIAAGRAQATAVRCDLASSGMLACRLHPSDAAQLIKQSKGLDNLEIACMNSAQDCVVAGPSKQLASLAAICSAENLKTKMLDVPYGFHSAAMDPILSELEQLTASTRCSSASIPIFSTVLGTCLSKDIDAQYFVAHTRQPVNFIGAIRDLEANVALEQSAFIEIGPHPVTIPLVSANLKTKPKCLSSLRKDIPAWVTLSDTLVCLSRTLGEINWRKVFDGTGAQLVNLPGHPLTPVRTGVEYIEHLPVQSMPTASIPAKFFFELREQHRSRGSEHSIYETHLGRLGTLINGHKVGGTAMCPASVLSELVFEAAHLANPPSPDYVWTVQGVKFKQPLIYGGEGDVRTIRVTIANETPVARFTIESVTDGSMRGAQYCEGFARLCSISTLCVDHSRHAAFVKRQRQQFTNNRSRLASFFQQSMLYDFVFARVVEYSAGYRSIHSFSTSPDGCEGYGAVTFPRDAIRDFVVAPVVSDTLLHAAGFVANAHTDASSVYICSHMDSMVVMPDMDLEGDHSIYCSLLHISSDTVLADSFLLDADDRIVAWAERIHFQRVRLSGFKASLERFCLEINKDNSSKPATVHRTSLPSRSWKPLEVPGPTIVLQPPTVKAQDTLSSISRVVADTCGIPENKLDMNQSLDALGIDSMLLLELSSAISKAIPGCSVDFGELSPSATLGDLADSIHSDKNRSRLCEPSPPSTAPNSFPSSPKVYLGTDEIEEALVAILASICGASAQAIAFETPLRSLGMSYAMLTELQATLEREMQVVVAMERLSKCENVRALRDILSTSTMPTRTTLPSVALSHPKPRLLTSTHNDSDGSYFKAPCFLFHDGSGFCSIYERLGDIHRPLWGFSSSTWSASLPIDGGLVEMAKSYASSIDAPEGGIILGGWSFGGVVAFEAACQLIARGVSVKGIILIDSPHPVDHVALPPAIINHVLQNSTTFTGMSAAARQALASNFLHHASLLQSYRPSGTKLGASTKAIVLSSRDVFNTQRCGVTYPWLSDSAEHYDAACRWQQFFEREISIKIIPGTHFEPFSADNIAATSEAFSWALREIDG